MKKDMLLLIVLGVTVNTGLQAMQEGSLKVSELAVGEVSTVKKPLTEPSKTSSKQYRLYAEKPNIKKTVLEFAGLGVLSIAFLCWDIDRQERNNALLRRNFR